MEVTSSTVLWFEFLFNRNRLLDHLQSEKPDPPSLVLIKQFLIHANKYGIPDVNVNGTNDKENSKSSDSSESIDFEVNERQRKVKMLKMMILQIAAHLNWDLDLLAKLTLTDQNLLMKTISNTANSIENDKKEHGTFLNSLYHRWVLRVLQNQIIPKCIIRTYSFINQIPNDQENTDWIKELNGEASIEFLKNLIVENGKEVKQVYIPNYHTFSKENPDWTKGESIEKQHFISLIHVDLGIYQLYKTQIPEAKKHFQNQKIPLENFPYYIISQEKLNGYLRALQLVPLFDKKIEDNKIKINSLNQDNTFELAKLLREGNLTKLKRVLKDDSIQIPSSKEQEKLTICKDIEDYDDDQKMELYLLEKNLIESSHAGQIKEILMSLHEKNLQKPIVKIFGGWELPIPLQHSIISMPFGIFQDYIYILVAKAKQLYNTNFYIQAKEMLIMAKGELQVQLQQSKPAGISAYLYNLSKVAQMLEWEILLVDVANLMSNWNPDWNHPGNKENETIVQSCKECLNCFQNQSSEINPRSEIVENILMALINLGEFQYITKFDEQNSSSSRWPFVEFLALLARVGNDLMEKKESSSNYRELWTSVISIFSTGGLSGNKKPISKPAILANRTSFVWVIERSRSRHLVTIWVSLLSKLHNHILDDVSLQIHTEYLHIWPNILDDLTNSIMEIKNRVSGTAKNNTVFIRDLIFNLLKKSISGSGDAGWLRIMGDVHLACGNASQALKCYIEYLAICTDFFENHSFHWEDNFLFKRMIKCSEILQCYNQAVILCQFLTEVDYSMAFGMAQEKITLDSSDALYSFIWDLTILEFLINLHTKRNEIVKRQQAIRVMGLLELNANNNEEIQREAKFIRRSQFMRTLAKQYLSV